MIIRRKAREIRVGDVKIGGDAPVSIQSMAKVETSDVKAVVSQIKTLEKNGCEIVRVAVKDTDDANAVRAIKRKIKIPLVCDIHFDYRLALKSIENGADKIRLNPGNIFKVDEISKVVKAAKNADIPIRIGANSGSVRKTKGSRPRAQGDLLVDSVLNYIKIFEDMSFRDIIISLKASDAVSTVDAYRKIATFCDYPLHLGLTASGPYDDGIVKSSIGIGALLLDGIGDTIRVSLTADPVQEVIAAKRILGALGLRKFGHEIISCPTCGRCQVDLMKIVEQLENAIHTTHDTRRDKPLTIAVMGCEVNGPGEAMMADIGLAAGKGQGALFKKGKIIKRVKEKDFVKEIMGLLKLAVGSR